MNFVKLLLAAFLFFVINKANAQPTLDTIKLCLKEKPHVFGKIDTRNSFVENSRAKIFGVKAGIRYNKRLSFGIGYNQIYPNEHDFDEDIYYRDENGLQRIAVAKLHLYYVSAHVEYVFYTTKHWQVSMPLQFGIGETFYKYKINSTKIKYSHNINFIYEPAISLEYKIIKFIGVGVDVGYRFMITSEKKLNQKFTSPTYAFKFLIYYGELYSTLVKKRKT